MIDRSLIQRQALQMAATQEAYLLRDGDRLNPVIALPQAVRLVRDYVYHLNQPDRATAFVLSFHPMIERWSSWAIWAEVLDLLLNLRTSDTPDHQTIHLLNCRSQAARELADDDTAKATALNALQLATAQQNETLMASAYNKLGLVALRRDELATATTYWNTAYLLGRRTLPAVELGHISMNMGIVAVQRGAYAVAEQHFTMALHQYAHQDNPIHMAKLHCNVADLQRRMGTLIGMPASVLSARDLFKHVHADYEYGLAENDIGCIYLALDQPTLAETTLLSAMTTFERIGAMTAKARVLSNLAALYVATTQWASAECTIREARDLASLCLKPLLIATIDVDYGNMLRARGDESRAQQIWEAALAVQQAKGASAAAARTRQLLDGLSSL